MSSDTPNKVRKHAPVISRSSILILTGILIGVTSTAAMQGGFGSLQFLAFAAALVGLLAFVGLDLVGQQRRFRAQRQAEEKALEVVEQRFKRHVLERAVKPCRPRSL